MGVSLIVPLCCEAPTVLPTPSLLGRGREFCIVFMFADCVLQLELMRTVGTHRDIRKHLMTPLNLCVVPRGEGASLKGARSFEASQSPATGWLEQSCHFQ